MDILIQNVNMLDGSGAPAYMGNVGVQDGKITLCDTKAHANTLIDGSGLYISPGFIDVHSHGDQVMGQYPTMLSKVSQGITTQVTGQCGGSAFPVEPARLDLLKDLISIGTYSYPEDMVNWTSFARFSAFADQTPMVINMKTFIGHSTLRVAAMGYAEGKPSAKEMEHMQSLLREAMEQGAMGLSSGLIYPPGCYGSLEELVALAKVIRPFGGIYATHMRNESDNILDAVKEALEVGRRAQVPVCISHHKVCGRQNWGKSEATLELIHKAIAEGMTVTIDQYPYTASSTHMNIVIPPHYFENGGIPSMLQALRNPGMRARIRTEMQTPGTYDNFYINAGGFQGMFISGCAKTPEADGMFVSEYAEKCGKDPFDALFDLLIENNGHVNGVFHCIGEDDNCRIILDPNACIGTDGTCRTLDEQTHPRSFGAFPRAIRRYVKELRLLPLEAMVHKMTGFAAARMGLASKGRIAEGMDADLVIFDLDKLCDTADYCHSTQLCEGIRYVLVNGEIAYCDNAVTPARAGRLIRHKGS